MSYKLLAIYFATSHFRQKTPLPAIEEKPTYKGVNNVYLYLNLACPLPEVIVADFVHPLYS